MADRAPIAAESCRDSCATLEVVAELNSSTDVATRLYKCSPCVLDFCSVALERKRLMCGLVGDRLILPFRINRV